MKKIKLFYSLLGLGLCTVTSSLFAQSDEAVDRYLSLREQSRRTNDNSACWAVSLSGGGTSYWGEKDVAYSGAGDWFSPFGRLTVERWFSSVWGLRLQADGGIQKNYIVREEGEGMSDEFTYVDGYVEIVTNVMNWGAYKRTQRPISIYLLGGAGMAWTPARKYVPSQLSPAAIVGGQLNIRMTDYWSLALELDGTVVKDNFNSHTGGRKFEGWATASVGLMYKFF